KIDRIEVRTETDDNVRLAGILSGDIDVTLANAGGPIPDQWATVHAQYVGPGLGQLIQEQVGRLNYATPKMTNPLFGGPDKVKVRQALTYALDREAIADMMVKDRGLVSNSWIQRGTPTFESQGAKIAVYPYDSAKAAQLM